ncbi:type II toxin-antitoxin system VapC family toxin [Luteimicrobium sp. NPDC057192]|uniref:type II toxin-antitoxin system VapC family toxin n=1 Tax=Luteimicrobium sp. NPDC057192 TaxID=3346042 RepID=UPI00362C874E
MIALDTHVVSELMRPRPELRVVAWADGLDPTQVGLPSVVIGELRYGVERLPPGRRRDELRRRLSGLLTGPLAVPVLAYDAPAAERYALLVVARELSGHPISFSDGQIAAICLANDAVLATRNTKDFTDTGVRVVNPWVSAPSRPG